MKNLRLPITLAMAALLGTGISAAGQIYKWVDEEGNVHYEDRPVATSDLERVDIVSRNTDNTVVQARVDADRKARAAARQVESEAPDDMSEEDLRAEKKERQQKCEQYRAQLEAFLRSTRLYQEDDAGDRTYLSDDEVMAARSRVEGQIQEYCGS